MKTAIDFSDAPKGAEYYYKDKYWKVVNGKLFAYELKQGYTFTEEYHWALSDYVIAITEKMIANPVQCVEKMKNMNIKPVYTQAMVDHNIVPLVGMEVMTPWGKGRVELIFMDQICCSNEHGIGLNELTEIKPLDTRTDKEKAIEKIMKIMADKVNYKHAAEAIYDTWSKS